MENIYKIYKIIIMAYCASFYCTSQIRFFQIEGLWQARLLAPFFQQYFGNSHNISNFYFYCIYYDDL